MNTLYSECKSNKNSLNHEKNYNNIDMHFFLDLSSVRQKNIFVACISCIYRLFFISLHLKFNSNGDNVRELEHIRRLESLARMYQDKSRV